MQLSPSERPSDQHDEIFDGACWDPGRTADDPFVAAVQAKLASCRHRAAPARRRLALAAVVLTAAVAAAAWLVLSWALAATPRAAQPDAVHRPLAVDESAPPAAANSGDHGTDSASDPASTR